MLLPGERPVKTGGACATLVDLRPRFLCERKIRGLPLDDRLAPATNRCIVDDMTPDGMTASISWNRPRTETACRSAPPAIRAAYARARRRRPASGHIGELPVVEVVEFRFRLEGAQHPPARIVDYDHDRVPAIAPAVAEFPSGHLERAVADQDQRPLAGRGLQAQSGRHAEAHGRVIGRARRARCSRCPSPGTGNRPCRLRSASGPCRAIRSLTARRNVVRGDWRSSATSPRGYTGADVLLRARRGAAQAVLHQRAERHAADRCGTPGPLFRSSAWMVLRRSICCADTPKLVSEMMTPSSNSASDSSTSREISGAPATPR